MDKEQKKFIIEKLADLEHEQWIEWSKNIGGSETISEDRLNRWRNLWKPYSELTDNEKEQDRVYARKVVGLLEKMAEEYSKNL